VKISDTIQSQLFVSTVVIKIVKTIAWLALVRVYIGQGEVKDAV